MDLSQVARSARWMTPEERALARRLLAALEAVVAAQGVPRGPMLFLRVADLLGAYLRARRLELALRPGDGPTANEAPAAALIEAVGKAWERTRKAMTELEAYLERHGQPAAAGLAGALQPIARRAAGAWEEAMAEDPEAKDG